ncbi:MAG TPA: hypothetical protein VGQ86_00750 [Candidatus Limnocylindria bacterium]|nr:hypothetical protein [Candidatus Limnocylindria bacterium]
MSLASGVLAVGAMFATDPDSALAVGVVIALLATCAGAVAAIALLSVSIAPRRRRPGTLAALRRGTELSAIVALLLLLRVVDGLTLITAGFIVAGFVVAEVILSARPGASSR